MPRDRERTYTSEQTMYLKLKGMDKDKSFQKNYWAYDTEDVGGEKVGENLD